MALLIVKFVIIIGRWRFLFEDGNRNAIIDEADYIISYKPLALKNATGKVLAALKSFLSVWVLLRQVTVHLLIVS